MPFNRIWLAVVACLSCLGIPGAGQAQTTDELETLLLRQAPGEVREVGVGVWIDQIKFVDQKAENFGVVGTLRLEWQDPALAFDAATYGRDFRLFERDDFETFASENALFYPGFVIQNQQEPRFSQSARFIVFSTGQAYYIEPFTTVLQAPHFNFVSFPFDTQEFFVHVVSTYPTSYVKYVPLMSHSGIGKKLGEEEWTFTDNWTEITTHEGVTGLPSSRFTFGLRARRHVDYYVLRIFTPLAIFVAVSWAAFFLQEYRWRIDLAGANLLIFVAFNFAISGDLPRLGYMTFLDFILVAMFVINGVIIVFNVGLRRLRVNDRDDLARKIDSYALMWIYPASHVGVISWAVYAYLYKPSLAAAG